MLAASVPPPPAQAHVAPRELRLLAARRAAHAAVYRHAEWCANVGWSVIVCRQTGNATMTLQRPNEVELAEHERLFLAYRLASEAIHDYHHFRRAARRLADEIRRGDAHGRTAIGAATTAQATQRPALDPEDAFAGAGARTGPGAIGPRRAGPGLLAGASGAGGLRDLGWRDRGDGPDAAARQVGRAADPEGPARCPHPDRARRR